MALVLNKDQTGWVDFTDTLATVPKANYLISDLNIFTPEYSSQKTVEIRQDEEIAHVLEDRNWDERNQTIAGGAARKLNLPIPHIPVDDAITPNDVDGKIEAPSIAAAMKLAEVADVRVRKMARLRNAHDLTMEVARWQLLRDGTVYSPRGTLATNYGPTVNFYTEFGVVRPDVEITTFAGAGDPRAEIERCRKQVLKGVLGTGGNVRVVALCGSDYFNALIGNAFVTNAMISVEGQLARQVLLGNLDAFGPNGRYRNITLWGVTFIEVSEAGYTDKNGVFQAGLGAKEARFIPVGAAGAFKTYFAPCLKFSTVNRKAQGSYWFEYPNEKDDIIEIMTEQNFLNAMLYPEAVVRSWIA